jgi:hypothetical protein
MPIIRTPGECLVPQELPIFMLDARLMHACNQIQSINLRFAS